MFRQLIWCLLVCFRALALLAQVPELSVPGHNLFVNKIAAAHALFPHWDGQGIVVSVKEFRFDSTDVDLKGRVLASPNAAANLSTHANIMATLAAGAGNASLSGRGAAPGCWLVSSKFEGLSPDANYRSQGVSVQCHAYGLPIQSRYGPGAAAYDASTSAHPKLLHVFSAGNRGDSFATDGLYAQIQGFANISGELKMAKNALVVGASDSLGRVFPYSSKGPAHDGRIKPDLTAFGQNGSSESAALVSGAAAVVQGALASLTDSLPDACLTRALLLNNTDDTGNKGPDFEGGYGNLNLLRALKSAQNRQFATGTVAAGQTTAFPLAVSPNTVSLQAMLAWDEPPAPDGAARALLRDLDLVLIAPSGNKCRPWVLNASPAADSLRKTATTGRDSLNNAEQVLVENPEPGLWEMHVSSQASYPGLQHFALTWRADSAEQFTWAYPLKQSQATAGKGAVLYWDSSFPENTAILEWKPLKADADWAVLTDSMPLRQGWWRQRLPDFQTEAQWRVRTGNGHTFFSDTVLIAPEIRVSVGFNCPDSVMLYWNRAGAALQYQLFGLGARQMEPLFSTADTFCVLRKGQFPQARFAVAPVGAVRGSRSPAPDIAAQGVDCYFSSFWAALDDGGHVALNLRLGTDYGLEKVFFQKDSHGKWLALAEAQALGAWYGATDTAAEPGRNRYRCLLHLKNGGHLVSDVADVYAVGRRDAWAFPNPLPRSAPLSVLTKEGEGDFLLFDLQGKKVFQSPLEGKKTDFDLNGLPPGMYLFNVRQGDSVLAKGKLALM